MKTKRVLGKGLSALIPDAGDYGQLGDKEVRMVPVDDIEFNPNQPRKSFNNNKLKELSESISQVGVLQPVLVRRHSGDGNSPHSATGGAKLAGQVASQEPGSSRPRYRVVAGERRLRAARLAGLSEIPAIICSYQETEALKVALLENIQREDLGPLEEASAYQNLLKAYGATQEELATMLGKGRASVTNSLRLLTLEPEIQELLSEDGISRGHAKALLGLPAGRSRVLLARTCARRQLSVRDCEQRVQKQTVGTSKRRRKARPEAPEVRALRERTERRLGSPVRIERNPTSGKGALTIRFYSDDDLERILEVMGVDTDLS